MDKSDHESLSQLYCEQLESVRGCSKPCAVGVRASPVLFIETNQRDPGAESLLRPR